MARCKSSSHRRPSRPSGVVRLRRLARRATLPSPGTDPRAAQAPFWTLGTESVLGELACGAEGLTTGEAVRRLERYGPNADKPARRVGIATAVARRLLEPLCLILLAAAIVSALTGDDIGGA